MAVSGSGSASGSVTVNNPESRQRIDGEVQVTSGASVDSKADIEALLERSQVNKAQGLQGSDQVVVREGRSVEGAPVVETQVPPPTAPQPVLDKDTVTNAETFMENLNLAMGNSMKNVEGSKKTENRSLGALSELTADQLLAEFMKLRIENPSDNTETHHCLMRGTSELKKTAIQDAAAKANAAAKMKKEAQEYARQAKVWGTVISVLLIIASVALAAATFGAAGALVVLACCAAGAIIGAASAEANGTDVGEGALLGASIGAAVGGIAAGPATAASQAAVTSAKTAAQAAAKAAASTADDAAQAAAQASAQTAAKAAQAAAEAAKSTADDALVQATKSGSEAAIKSAQKAADAAAQAATKATAANTAAQAGKFAQAAKGFAEAGKASYKAASLGLHAQGAFMKYMLSIGILTGVGEGAKGGMNLKAAEKSIAAQEMDIAASKRQHHAELLQEIIEEEGEVFKMIMESRNAVMASIQKMLALSHASQLNVIASGSSK